ncbi:MAG: hypothetical protein ACEQSK_02320 [Sphingomonadaceae bacterium]
MKPTRKQPATTLPEASINTAAKVRNDGKSRLPHERDEAPDAQRPPPRSVMQQAASDLEQGLVDTDRHASPGVEQVHPRDGAPGQAKPQPGSKRD